MTPEEQALIQLLMDQYGMTQEEALMVAAQAGGINPDAYGSDIYDTSTSLDGGMASAGNPTGFSGSMVNPMDLPAPTMGSSVIAGNTDVPPDPNPNFTRYTNARQGLGEQPYPEDWGLGHWQQMLASRPVPQAPQLVAPGNYPARSLAQMLLNQQAGVPGSDIPQTITDPSFLAQATNPTVLPQQFPTSGEGYIGTLRGPAAWNAGTYMQDQSTGANSMLTHAGGDFDPSGITGSIPQTGAPPVPIQTPDFSRPGIPGMVNHGPPPSPFPQLPDLGGLGMRGAAERDLGGDLNDMIMNAILERLIAGGGMAGTSRGLSPRSAAGAPAYARNAPPPPPRDTNRQPVNKGQMISSQRNQGQRGAAQRNSPPPRSAPVQNTQRNSAPRPAPAAAPPPPRRAPAPAPIPNTAKTTSKRGTAARNMAGVGRGR